MHDNFDTASAHHARTPIGQDDVAEALAKLDAMADYDEAPALAHWVGTDSE